MPALQISLLGQFQVTLEGGRQARGFRSNRAQALLAYLAVEADRAHRRETLMALLWPDEPDSTARTNLRTALFNLRQAIGDAHASPPFLLVTPDTLRFNPAAEHSLDVSDFNGAIGATNSHPHAALGTCRHCMKLLAGAVERYRGDFLSGFSLPDCVEFEEWAATHRERLQQQALGAVDTLVAYHERRGELEKALGYARRHLELDPWHEETHRLLMRLLARQGKREAALAQYETCHRVLAEELGLEPGVETAELAEQIRRGELGETAGDASAVRLYNLAAQTTSLLGREAELVQLATALAKPGVRLVTLVGPPGIGKTRLAQEVAAQQADDYVDGVCYVELAPLRDPGLVLPTIAATLGVQDRGGQPIQESLHEYLRDKHLLLVVDNFEHLLPATPLVAALLKACAQVQVLTTSRAALRVAGENEFPVPPLAVPDPQLLTDGTADAGVFAPYSAVQLFVERGRAIQPGFALTAANGRAVAAICARLDGLPLAIELAAARIRLFGPGALLGRLDRRLQVLIGGPRERDPRQQTLRNTIEWSYDLLSDGEKHLFRRMSVFQGGRTLEGVEAVCNYDGRLGVEVLEGVEALMSQSLLQQREGSDGESRFLMLETIHEYAREKLNESGEAETLQREHALYFMRLAEEAEPQLEGPKQREWLDRLGDEYDNIRTALQWASEQGGEAEAGGEQAGEAGEARAVGPRIAGAIFRFWLVRGLLSEGREHLRKSLATAEVEATAQEHLMSTPHALRSRAKALNAASHFAGLQADYSAARSLAQAALVLGRELEDKQIMAVALNQLGNVAMEQGDFTAARPLYEESLAISRELGDKGRIAIPLHNLGLVTEQQGDFIVARALYEQSLALGREIGDRHIISFSLVRLAGVTAGLGDFTAARPLYEESLAINRELGHKQGIAGSLDGLGNAAREQGDFTTARALLEESLDLKRELGYKQGISISLRDLGIVAQEQGDFTAALTLYEQSLALCREIGYKQGIGAALSRLGIMAQEQGDFTAARALLEESLVLRRERRSKRGIAECLAGLGGVAVRGAAGVGREVQVERGARLLGAAEGLLQSIGTVLYREDREPYEQSVQQARARLGVAVFQKAWEEGHAMSMEQAIAYALEEATTPASNQQE